MRREILNIQVNQTQGGKRYSFDLGEDNPFSKEIFDKIDQEESDREPTSKILMGEQKRNPH